MADTTQNQLHDLLYELGRQGTASGVAYHLLGEGASGVPRASGSCPLANYITRRLAVTRAVVVIVGGGQVYIETTEGIYTTTDVPGVLWEFVNSFDRGAYPFLDERLAGTDEKTRGESA